MQVEKLIITLVHLPFFIPCSYLESVESHIAYLFDGWYFDCDIGSLLIDLYNW